MRSEGAPKGKEMGSQVEYEANEGSPEVGSAHISLRAGKPFTWRQK